MTDLFLADFPYVFTTNDGLVRRIIQTHCKCKHTVEFDASGVFEHADLQLARIAPTWCLCAEHAKHWKDTAPHCGCYTTEHVSGGGHYVDVTHHRCSAHEFVMQLERFIADERKHRRQRIRTMRALAIYTVPSDIRIAELLFDTARIRKIALFALGGCAHCELVRNLEVEVTVVTHPNAFMSHRLQSVPCVAPVLPCARCSATTVVTAARVYCVDDAGHAMCKECQPTPNAKFTPALQHPPPHDDDAESRAYGFPEVLYATQRVQVSANVPCSYCSKPNEVKLACCVALCGVGIAEQLLLRVPGITPILRCAACQHEEPATPFQLLYDDGGYRYQMFCAVCAGHNNHRPAFAQQFVDLQ